MRKTSLRGGTTKQSPAITERPILFQTEMVQAILEGRKTQTRREVKNVDLKENVKGAINYSGKLKGSYQGGTCIIAKHLNYPLIGILNLCKYGKPGDLLWVRETWAHTKQLNINFEDESYGYVYKSDDCIWESYEGWRWKPSIHMPKLASRIWLMIEDIRVERVQDISEKDARAEGVKYHQSDNIFYKGYQDYLKRDLDDPNYMFAAQSFGSLWISINGEESWHANPWVWVIQFRVLSTTGKPSDEVIQKNLSDLSDSAVSKSEIRNPQSEIE